MAAHARKPAAGARRIAAPADHRPRDHARVVLSDPRELSRRLAALPGAAHALQAIGDAGQEVYLVGGAVRDLALGAAPLDLDLVVAGDVRALASRLAAAGERPRVHRRFGTATVRGPEGVRYDLAAARAETYAAPGALPEVTPAGIRDDLARRDFTVNAVALGLSGPDAGRLLAVARGVEDLEARRLRVLHERSFLDDPTRLLRVARYAGRLGFAVEPGTARLAREAIGAGALATVSGGRIGAELWLLAADRDPVAGFEVMRELGLDAALAPGFGLRDPGVARRALAAAARSPADPARVVLAAALLDVPEPERRPLLERLALDRRARGDVLAAAAEAPALARRVPADGPPSRLLDALPAGRPVTVALASGLGSPPVAAALTRWLCEDAQVRLEIDGDDLIGAGVRRGPAVSRGLRAALGARLDGIAPTRERQLAVALDAARGGQGAGSSG
jgi:tRNA nucleotidyltransferase (CCA-adding enzyme)